MATTTKRASEIQPGDMVVERDGATLLVTHIDEVGASVVLTFARSGIIPVGPARVRKSAMVRVVGSV